MKSVKKLLRRRGVTIIELMVVIVIIGLLMTVILVTIKPGQIDEKLIPLKMKKSKAAINAALLEFNMVYNRYPTTEEGLDALINPPVPESGYAPKKFLIDDKAVLDPWNHPFVYENEDGEYKIISLGADNAPGGEGLNRDIDLNQFE